MMIGRRSIVAGSSPQPQRLRPRLAVRPLLRRHLRRPRISARNRWVRGARSAGSGGRRRSARAVVGALGSAAGTTALAVALEQRVGALARLTEERVGDPGTRHEPILLEQLPAHTTVARQTHHRQTIKIGVPHHGVTPPRPPPPRPPPCRARRGQTLPSGIAPARENDDVITVEAQRAAWF